MSDAKRFKEIKADFGDCDWMRAIFSEYTVESILWLIGYCEKLEKEWWMKNVYTKEEFEALDAFTRGYVVYMAGCRDDQPNIPDEENPYSKGSDDYDLWSYGNQQAIVEAQDCDD